MALGAVDPQPQLPPLIPTAHTEELEPAVCTLKTADGDSLSDAGDVVAFIDWDGIATYPRQIGALAYPSWLTVDWDPLMYDGYKKKPHYDTEEDLHTYRKMYSDAVDVLPLIS